jgi:hypothetical protein
MDSAWKRTDAAVDKGAMAVGEQNHAWAVACARGSGRLDLLSGAAVVPKKA